MPHYGNDLGGWIGNLYPLDALLGKNVTVCSDEAVTYLLYLETLQNRGLLQHYRSLKRLVRRGRVFPLFHMGSVIERRADGQILVLDSWQRNGRQPAKIYYLEDWMRRRDRKNL